MYSSIYKEHGLRHALRKSSPSKKLSSNPYRVRVVYKGKTEYFNTSAASRLSAINNAVYRFAQKHLQMFDTRDFSRFPPRARSIAVNSVVKEVALMAKINIVE